MPTQVKYNYAAARQADSLVSWLAIDYVDHGRVDWEQSTKLRLTPSGRQALAAVFLPWLQRNFDIKQGLIAWAANPQVTAQGVRDKLSLFSRLTYTSLATATILRGAAQVLREERWVQHFSATGPSSSVEPGGFDVIGAIAVHCENNQVDQRLRVAAIEAVRLYMPQIGVKTNVTVTDWNDAPGRTKRDVLHLLSACADDIETI